MDDCQNYNILHKKPHIAISYATWLYFLFAKVLHHNFPCDATIFSLWKIKTTLGRILRKNNYFKIKTGAEHEALTDTNYGSNYDEIFKSNDPELDGQIPPTNKLDTQLDSKSSSKINYGDGIDKLFQDNGFLNDTFFH